LYSAILLGIRSRDTGGLLSVLPAIKVIALELFKAFAIAW
jgi:uncharacterized membrane protein